MNSLSSPMLVVLAMLALFQSCAYASGEVHVSIMNRLGEGRSLDVHCQSKDNDLGQQTLADGSEYGWDFSVNVWGSTLFYCRIGWERVSVFDFDSFSYDRDWLRCKTRCSWLISNEGVYGMNDKTGLWEFMYLWPNN